MKAAISKLNASITPPADGQKAREVWNALTTRMGELDRALPGFQSLSEVYAEAKTLGNRLSMVLANATHGPHTISAWLGEQERRGEAIRAAAQERGGGVAAARADVASGEEKKTRVEACIAEIESRQARAADECARQREDAGRRYAEAIGEGNDEVARAAQAALANLEVIGTANDASARADAPVLSGLHAQQRVCEQNLEQARLALAESIAADAAAAVAAAEFTWNAAAGQLALAAVHCQLEHTTRGQSWNRGEALSIPLFKRGDDCPGAVGTDKGMPTLGPRTFQNIRRALAAEPAAPLIAEVHQFMESVDKTERELIAAAAEASARSAFEEQSRREQAWAAEAQAVVRGGGRWIAQPPSSIN